MLQFPKIQPKASSSMKRILITNDDGYEADGLHALIDAVKGLGQITVVAPATEKSACAHSITLTRPLRFVSVGDDFYKLDDGTPSDCVYLAMHSIFDQVKPDLVLSGINRGANMGEDITYSGTASAAMEGVIHGVPSIAFSQVMTKTEGGIYDYDLALAKIVVRDLAAKVLDGGFPLAERKFLNVNIPNIGDPENCKGYKVTKAGYRLYGNDAHRHLNPRGDEYFWLGLHPLQWTPDIARMCDFDAIEDGYVSITPVMLDMTCHDSLEKLREWIS